MLVLWHIVYLQCKDSGQQVDESQQDQIIHEFCERCMHVAVKY